MDASDIFLAIPTRGAVRPELVSLIERVRGSLHPDLYATGYVSGKYSSHESREEIVTYFMNQTDKNVLVMVDDDIVPPLNFLYLTSTLNDYDIVGAACPIFQPHVASIPMLAAQRYVEEEDGYLPLDDVWGQQGVVECDAVGFGCVAIHRRVFEKLSLPWFRMDRNHRGTMTDDVSFCRRAKGAGFRVACDFDILCEHYSTVPLLKLSKGMSDLIDDVTKR